MVLTEVKESTTTSTGSISLEPSHQDSILALLPLRFEPEPRINTGGVDTLLIEILGVIGH